jgi:4-amino-4-deoxy-L-arabinose transferase-like glycosyltransferase
MATELARLARNSFERLFEPLLDPALCDRTMALLLTGYAATWTLYAIIAHGSQDLSPDMTELIAWSRDLGLGYLKHPPLAACLVWLWFKVFPLTDWSYYLLAMLMPTIALWIVWRLSADYLDIEKRVAAVALLMFVPFYNFHALNFNPNTVLLPTWAATTLFFLRSYNTRNTLYSVLAGVGAAASMLGKYWSVFLLAGLAVAALSNSRRAWYFRSAAPWVTIATATIVLAPHLFWLYHNNFAPLEYAVAHHAANSFAGVAAKILDYLAGSAAYSAVPVVVVLAMARPNRATIFDMVWPVDRDRQLAAAAFWSPLLLPILGAAFAGINLSSLWTMSDWTLLPVLLLSSPSVKFWPGTACTILAVALALPLAMLVAAPAVALAIHLTGVAPPTAHSRLLSAEVERAWHRATPQPLRYVSCNAASGVITYAQDRPRPLPMRSYKGNIADQIYADINGWPKTAGEPAVTDAELAKSGVAFACFPTTDGSGWIQVAEKQAARNPASQRVDIDLTRDYLGIPGSPQHYVIFIVPPRQ